MEEREYCNNCNTGTKHELIAGHEQTRYDYDWGAKQFQCAQILKCCGCDDISFRLFIHPYDFQNKEDAVHEFIFPDRSFKKRKKEFFFHIPKKIVKIYNETNTAYDNELYLFAAIGIRTLLEAIVVDKFDSSEYSASIKSKIDSLKKHFNQDVIEILQELRFLGNKAVHDIEEPDKRDIHTALNVVESILTFYYKVEENVRHYRDQKKQRSLT